MSLNAFGITSPHLDRVVKGLQRTNIELVTRDAAVSAGQRLVAPLRASASAAGGSAGMVNAIQVHDGHLNDLVMRDRGQRGDVIVGVDGRSTYADEAEDLEWGSIHDGPKAWVRTTVAHHSRDVLTMWSNALSRGLDASVLR